MLSFSLTGIPKHGLPIDLSVEAERIRPEGAERLPCKDLHLQGNLNPIGGDYLFSGEIRGEFEHPCDRCLVIAPVPFAVPVDWLFTDDAPEPVSEDENEDSAESRVWPIEGDVIDLGPQMWEEATLAFPGKYLCREDCQGLCARCGANLNDGPCGCDTETTEDKEDNPRGLAALADLYPDLAPGSKKESNHAGTEEKNG